MDKVKMRSFEFTQENIKALSNLFPMAVTESSPVNGITKLSVNFDVLKQLLGQSVVSDSERYEFCWVGKSKSIQLSTESTSNTLRPDIFSSKNWDTTQNLYLEGDNLDALKILEESYLGKVKVIYIDPPYNTGADSFIYSDCRTMGKADYIEQTNMFDEDGNLTFKENPINNPRFHSDWCSMILSRLMHARNFLSDDGVIFISIDDHEQENLKKICNEVFGEKNFIAQVVWERAYSPVNLKKHFSESHDYILCYAKNIDSLICNGFPRSDESNSRYDNPDNDPRGPWKSSDLSVGPAIQSKIYEITTPTGRKVLPPSGYCWRLDKQRLAEYIADNRIWFGTSGNNVPSIKRFLSEVKQGMTPMTLWKYTEVGHSQDAKQKLKNLFDGKSFFDYPKPVELIKRCLQLYSNPDSIVLDFFSGSATTAHAVMQLNAEDGGHRKFIMVQLPEPCDEKSEAYKAGYKNICEIGKERIRRAGDKIKAEHPDADLDIGFRVFRVDSSNMRDVYYKPEEFTQTMLGETVSNIKPDRTDLDLLYACLLDCGVPIHLPHTTTTVDGCTIHNVDNGALMACFDEHIPHSVIRAMAAEAPLQVIFRDSAFAADADKINVTEIFKNLSPDTKVRVI